MGATSGAVDKNKFGRELEAVIQKITTIQPEVDSLGCNLPIFLFPRDFHPFLGFSISFLSLLFIHITSFQQ